MVFLLCETAFDGSGIYNIRHAARLTANIERCALFDSKRFTRDLERLFARMWANHRAGRRQAIVLGDDETGGGGTARQ